MRVKFKRPSLRTGELENPDGGSNPDYPIINKIVGIMLSCILIRIGQLLINEAAITTISSL